MNAIAASITIIFDTNSLISCLIVSVFPKIQPFPHSGKSPRLPNLNIYAIFIQIPVIIPVSERFRKYRSESKRNLLFLNVSASFDQISGIISRF
jgi:hypothetical protein